MTTRKPATNRHAVVAVAAGVGLCALLCVCGTVVSALDGNPGSRTTRPSPAAPAVLEPEPAGSTTSAQMDLGPTPEPSPDDPDRDLDLGDDDGDVYYPNCAAVRAAGAAPIRRGDPGYSRKLDRDGDGVGCE